MKIVVKARPGAREQKVEMVSQSGLELSGSLLQLETYKVAVKEKPTGGRANTAIARALADYFGVGRAHVTLLSGHTSRTKIFEIFT